MKVGAGKTAPEVLPRDFFISYAHQDIEWAQKVSWWLEDAGYSVFFAPWDFRPGHNFVLMMHRASMAGQTLAILTEQYLEANYTQPEWASRLADDPHGTARSLIPIRVGRCEPSGLLRGVLYIDICGLDEVAAREKVLEGVRPGRAKPTSEPPFPGEACFVEASAGREVEVYEAGE